MAKQQSADDIVWVGVRKVPGEYGSYEVVERGPGGPVTVSPSPESAPFALERARHTLLTRLEAEQHKPAANWPKRVA